MLALLSLVWGASYLLIKYAAQDLPEAWVVLLRTALAAAALWVVIVRNPQLRRDVTDLRRRPGTALLLGVTAIGAPFLLITFGERTVPSGLTAVLIAAAPIFIAILAPALDRSETMTRRQWVGLVLGIVGVGMLVGVEQVHSLGAFLGAMAMIGAAACYAVSGFVLKRCYAGAHAVVTSFISIATASIAVAPVAALTPPRVIPGARALIAVVALGLVGTAFAFVVYYRLIGEVGYGRASVVAYTIPPVALAYGAFLLDERIGPAMVGGMSLILAGVYLVARATSGRTPPAAPAGATTSTTP